MSQIVKAAKNTKTVTLPRTVREIYFLTFKGTALLSVIVNEGLETLGKYLSNEYYGIFSNTRVR